MLDCIMPAEVLGLLRLPEIFIFPCLYFITCSLVNVVQSSTDPSIRPWSRAFNIIISQISNWVLLEHRFFFKALFYSSIRCWHACSRINFLEAILLSLHSSWLLLDINLALTVFLRLCIKLSTLIDLLDRDDLAGVDLEESGLIYRFFYLLQMWLCRFSWILSAECFGQWSLVPRNWCYRLSSRL